MAETDSTTVELPDSPDGEPEVRTVSAPDADASPDPETFPRAYVEELRAEAAANRVKAKRADELAEEVFLSRVSALGKLADPTDLPFAAELLEDRSAMEAAVDELIATKPHLADRRPTGDIDQGARGTNTPVNLAAMLRART